MRLLIDLLISAILLAIMSGLLVTRVFEWPLWSSSILLVALALVLYLANSLLIGYYITARAPEMATKEPCGIPGLEDVQTWELTAGLGIVPKWVSFIGLLSVSCIVAAVLNLGRSLGWF